MISIMKINLTSVFVDDQEKALKFYTEKLGFIKKQDIPLGENRWLTVESADSEGMELLLEPNDNPAAKTYQKALFDQKIPATSFESSDIQEEYKCLVGKGITFIMEPTDFPGTILAIFDDTCGNLIQIHQSI